MKKYIVKQDFSLSIDPHEPPVNFYAGQTLTEVGPDIHVSDGRVYQAPQRLWVAVLMNWLAPKGVGIGEVPEC